MLTWLQENWPTVARYGAAALAAIAGGSAAWEKGWLKWLSRKPTPVPNDDDGISPEDEIDTAAYELLRVAKIARTQGRDAVLNHTLDALSALLKPVKGDVK